MEEKGGYEMCKYVFTEIVLVFESCSRLIFSKPSVNLLIDFVGLAITTVHVCTCLQRILRARI